MITLLFCMAMAQDTDLPAPEPAPTVEDLASKLDDLIEAMEGDTGVSPDEPPPEIEEVMDDQCSVEEAGPVEEPMPESAEPQG